LRAPVPMQSLKYELEPDAKCLVVLLPGLQDTMHVFDEIGMVNELRDSGLSFDVIAADATLGYYTSTTVVTRLHDDVIEPAMLAKTYQHVWLMGPSIAGFGALLYAQHHPDKVAGVIAFAPYLGDEDLLKEIRDSGGLKKWAAPAVEQVSDETYQRQLWRWIQEVTTGKTKGPEIYVAWGTSDRLGPADEVLADALPLGHSLTPEGKHDWPPWKVALEKWLEDSALVQQCAP
jgi:S-formylglutathione hydrolase FrmB